MKIQLDFRSGQPIYTQIVEQITQMVASGELKEGDQLPTVRHLATELRVNFNTVARAYRILDETGLISTQQGRGTYIWTTPSDDRLHRLHQEGLDVLTRRYLAEAARLSYSAEEVARTITPYLQAWRDHNEIPTPDGD